METEAKSPTISNKDEIEAPSPPSLPQKPVEAEKRKWSQGDNYKLLEIMAKGNGKNWQKNLEDLHKAHRLTHLTYPIDADKVRRHYNSLNGKDSPLKNPYKRPVYRATKKGKSEEQLRLKEAEFAKKHQQAQNDHDQVRMLVVL